MDKIADPAGEFTVVSSGVSGAGRASIGRVRWHLVFLGGEVVAMAQTLTRYVLELPSTVKGGEGKVQGQVQGQGSTCTCCWSNNLS